MRTVPVLLLLAGLAGARPPVSPEYRRLDDLKQHLNQRYQELVEAEEYAKKPREEKILISFEKGETKFDKRVLDGKFAVEAVLEWADVNRNDPTEAGKRTLEMLPTVLEKRYARVVEVPKDRYDMCKILVKALDSNYLHIRIAAIASLKKIYRTETAFMYEPEMDSKQRRDPIRSWSSFIRKQK